jgi:glycosyltransferase involved in cell wall biosynthesis
MFADKQMKFMTYVPNGLALDGRAIGNIATAYFVDHKKVHAIDPIAKAAAGRYRQSVTFCMIAMNEEGNILRCLNSIIPFADQIQIALGPSTDNTRAYITTLLSKHQYLDWRIIDVPKIEVDKFGFDDARNASVSGADGDWIFWIDSDEYLSGRTFKEYLRNNSFDSYAVSQHHFTCEPRGAPTQIDKPARIYRNNGKFKFFGKVHEHAELGFNGGPGAVMMLNSIDIGHIGYVNEGVRRDRFSRNFPLLKWDRKVYPDRRIGKFLWFRDLFHQMQWCAEQNKIDEARHLAQEAVDFFKASKDEFLYIGSGPQTSLHYYSEANRLLGRGHHVKVNLEMEGMNAEYQGLFDSSQEAFEIAERAVKEQIEKRASGYWQ